MEEGKKLVKKDLYLLSGCVWLDYVALGCTGLGRARLGWAGNDWAGEFWQNVF